MARRVWQKNAESVKNTRIAENLADLFITVPIFTLYYSIKLANFQYFFWLKLALFLHIVDKFFIQDYYF